MREISNNIYQTKYTPCPLNNIYCTKIQGDTYILSNEVTIIGMYPKEGYIQEAERLLAACTPEDIFEELLWDVRKTLKRW